MGVTSEVNTSKVNTTLFSIYCDFDGTISDRDMIGVLAKRFAPEIAKDTIAAVNRREISIRDGVEAIFESIPSDELPQLEAYATSQTSVRGGFPEFVQWCKSHGWRLAVVSGGFDFFVQPVVSACNADIDVYCNSLNASGEFLEVRWNHTCDNQCDGTCGLCKPSVIRERDREHDKVIVIGDGVTDVLAAKMADFVFARDKLLEECRRLGLPHAPFETFYDIVKDPYWNREEEV